MPKPPKTPTIRMSPKTKQLLANFGRKNDTYEKIVISLINQVAHCRQNHPHDMKEVS
jgi:hypothetical protein